MITGKDVTYLKEVHTETSCLLLKITLENDTEIFLHKHGYAIDRNGNIYHSVAKEVNDELIILGWSCEIQKEVII